MSRPAAVLLLSRADVQALLSPDAALEALEAAYAAAAAGRSRGAGVLGLDAAGGTVHAKAAAIDLESPLVAVKVNANFPDNPGRFGLPTIQGLLLLIDGERGMPLAVMDSVEITRVRTAATTALAARRLANPESSTATVCGCGVQGRAQLEALARVLPLRRAFAWDLDPARAREFVREASGGLGLRVTAVDEVGPSARASDVVATCTPACRFFLGRDDVKPGAFVAAVGSDNPHKQELDPALVAASTVVVDDLAACASSGELHHALEAGLMSRADVYAELVDLVSGRRPGRTDAAEIVVFDSTGSAVQDLAAAAHVFTRARAVGAGWPFDFFGRDARLDPAPRAG